MVGDKKRLDAFAEHPATTKQRATLSSGTKGLAAAAVHWLEYGELGLSSYAIFHRMTGPHDPGGMTAPTFPLRTSVRPALPWETRVWPPTAIWYRLPVPARAAPPGRSAR